jgi:hypothetical protein
MILFPFLKKSTLNSALISIKWIRVSSPEFYRIPIRTLPEDPVDFCGKSYDKASHSNPRFLAPMKISNEEKQMRLR